MSKHRSPQTLQIRIEDCSRIIVAVAVMVWSARNFWNNVLQFRALQETPTNWGVAAMLVLAFTVVPFGVGVGLLLRSLRAKPPGP